MTFTYCKWHCIANAEIPNFNLNSSGLRLIRHRYREGRTSTKSRMPGLKEYLSAEKSRPDVSAEDSQPASPHETQEEIDEALGESMLPSSPRVDEYGSNIPPDENVRTEAAFGTSGDSVPLDEPSERPQHKVPENRSPSQRPAEVVFEETDPVMEPTGQAEETEAPVLAKSGSKRPGPPRTKRLAKRARREQLIGVDTGSKSDDDIPLSQLHVRLHSDQSVMIEDTAEDTSTTRLGVNAIGSATFDSVVTTAAPVVFDLSPRTESTLVVTAELAVDALTPISAVSDAPITSTTIDGIPTVAASPTGVTVPATAVSTTAIAIFTTAVSTVTTSVSQSKAVSPPATPSSSFELSKEYGVSMIRNNFLAILRESPTQVLDRGGDFAGIKAVLEPLLNVMQSLTSATATLPYWTHLAKVENLFKKWQNRRGQSLFPMIEDRTMQLLRQRDDSQFELERQILEKKKTVQELGEMTVNLFNENKRVADAERNQQLLVESYRIALADIQAKLAEAESALKITAERHQALTAEWTEHQKLVQVQSDELEKLSDVISTMKILSDDDLRKQATEEVETAHREVIVQLAEEIRQAVEQL